MAHQRCIGIRRQSVQAEGRRRGRRVLGADAAAGAFLAFGLTPLATAPPAQADEFGWLADLFDPSAWITPDAAPLLGADGFGDQSVGGLLNFLDGGDPTAAFYTSLHTGIESWISNPFGQVVDGLRTAGGFVGQ